MAGDKFDLFSLFKDDLPASLLCRLALGSQGPKCVAVPVSAASTSAVWTATSATEWRISTRRFRATRIQRSPAAVRWIRLRQQVGNKLPYIFYRFVLLFYPLLLSYKTGLQYWPYSTNSTSPDAIDANPTSLRIGSSTTTNSKV